MIAWRIAASMTLLLSFPLAVATAQTPDLEPGVQTSEPQAKGAAPLPAPAASQPSPSSSAPQSGARPAAPAASAVPAAPANPGAAAATGAAKGGSKSQDRIELDTTQISGNRELPKVMYVVPWRKADLGEFAGRPPNSLLDEALTPVDRDVFRRQNRYFAALQAGPGDAKSQPGVGAGNGAAPESKDEK
jgi:hypothetical protein